MPTIVQGSFLLPWSLLYIDRDERWRHDDDSQWLKSRINAYFGKMSRTGCSLPQKYTEDPRLARIWGSHAQTMREVLVIERIRGYQFSVNHFQYSPSIAQSAKASAAPAAYHCWFSSANFICTSSNTKPSQAIALNSCLCRDREENCLSHLVRVESAASTSMPNFRNRS
jgi:hypothetical protein